MTLRSWLLCDPYTCGSFLFLKNLPALLAPEPTWSPLGASEVPSSPALGTQGALLGEAEPFAARRLRCVSPKQQLLCLSCVKEPWRATQVDKAGGQHSKQGLIH